MHWSGVAHRDIKAGNVLFNQQNYEAMISDFGLAASLSGYMGGNDTEANKSRSGKMFDQIGTTLFYPPEIMELNFDSQ